MSFWTFRSGLRGECVYRRDGVLLPQRGTRRPPNPLYCISTLQQAQTPPNHRRQTLPRWCHRKWRQWQWKWVRAVVCWPRVYGHFDVIQGVFGRCAPQGLHTLSAGAPVQVHSQVARQDIPQPRSSGQSELESLGIGSSWRGADQSTSGGGCHVNAGKVANIFETV